MIIKPIHSMMHSNFKCVCKMGNYLAFLLQYFEMFKMLIENDIKGRFKNTFLGYFWHLLNPLSQIVIYLVIFTVIFGKSIPNYWVYISTGMFAYSFFLSCCNSGCNAIVGNSNMITKMTFAREILVFSKVGSNLITLSISYTLLTILMAIAQINITVNILYIPVIILMLSVFSTGLSLLLAAITVYIRDTANAVRILLNCMMFAIPIFYTTDKITSDPFIYSISSINPLYYFINCIHDAFYYGISPDMIGMAFCLISSIIIFVVGLYVFKRLEPGFAERL